MPPISELAFDTLRERINDLERDLAVRAETQRNILARLDKIDGNLSRIMWIIISAVAASVLAYVLNKGGVSGILPPVT